MDEPGTTYSVFSWTITAIIILLKFSAVVFAAMSFKRTSSGWLIPLGLGAMVLLGIAWTIVSKLVIPDAEPLALGRMYLQVTFAGLHMVFAGLLVVGIYRIPSSLSRIST